LKPRQLEVGLDAPAKEGPNRALRPRENGAARVRGRTGAYFVISPYLAEVNAENDTHRLSEA
jgi:hypothetical protein